MVASRPAALGALLALLLVAGCASQPTVLLPDLEDWQTRQATLAGLEAWNFRGRVAVTAGDDGFNGRLNWQQRADDFAATVSGPLGMGTVRLEGDTRRVILTDKDGERTTLEDAEADLRYRYGWSIPVSSLRYWALGIPDPAYAAETELDDQGRLLRLEQGGWTVQIDRYDRGGGQWMPARVSALGPDTRVRLVIDDWSFGAR